VWGALWSFESSWASNGFAVCWAALSPRLHNSSTVHTLGQESRIGALSLYVCVVCVFGCL